jgi:hypothetical protein
MSNLICKENFNWKKYIERYKDLKSIDNIDSAWNQWCEEGRKQGRKFFTLAPYKNNKYYIITKEYIKQKKNKLKNTQNTKNVIVSGLDDDIVIEDFVTNIKHKLKKLNKNKTFVCQTVNQNIDDKSIKKQEIKKDKSNIKKNNDIEILEKTVIYNDKHIEKNDKHIEKNDKHIEKNDKHIIKNIIKKQPNEEWTMHTENSEIFFLDVKSNNDDSNESKKYFSKKNPLNIFSNSS